MSEDWEQRMAELDAKQERGKKLTRELLLLWIGVSLAAATIDYLAQRNWWAWIVWPVVVGLVIVAVAIITAIVDWGSKSGRTIAAGVAIAGVTYALLWEGGNLSYDYTHKCVRSHVETVVDKEGNESNIRVCDYFAANGNQWGGIFDPIRAIAKH